MEKLGQKLVAILLLAMLMIIVFTALPAAVEAARADRFHPDWDWKCCHMFPVCCPAQQLNEIHNP